MYAFAAAHTPHLEEMRGDDVGHGAGVVQRRRLKAKHLLVSHRKEQQQLPDQRHKRRGWRCRPVRTRDVLQHRRRDKRCVRHLQVQDATSFM